MKSNRIPTDPKKIPLLSFSDDKKITRGVFPSDYKKFCFY